MYMNKNPSRERIPALLGIVEPHAPLLTAPPDTQPLYKVMSIENLLRSIEGNYLYFNRVDSYADFSGADLYDGRQLPKDQPGNASVGLIKAPEFSALTTTISHAPEPMLVASPWKTQLSFGKIMEMVMAEAKPVSYLISEDCAR